MTKHEHMQGLLAKAGASGPKGPYMAYFHFFNRQEFYEAHDVLESLWLTERKGANNGFYKALIQLAGAFVHLQKRRVKPAIALFKLARSYLARYPGRHEGLNVAEVLKMMDGWLQRLERIKDDFPQIQGGTQIGFELEGVSLRLGTCD